MYQKYALFSKQKGLFVMYCVEVLLYEYTHNLNERKKIVSLKIQEACDTQTWGGGGNTLVYKVIARYLLLSYSPLQLLQLLPRQSTVTQQPT
jgi:hypothetical protein